ncbi:MAG: carbamoyltransferase HypF, partial [Candidatus Promineifilaceae bacterium]
VADPQENNAYPIDLDGSIIDPSPLIERAVADARSGVSASIVSARFHNGLASMVAEVCAQIRRQHKLSKVILSGGVWQNMTLLQKSVLLLESSGFETYLHRLVPANDGGIALGQVAVAAHRLRKGQLS